MKRYLSTLTETAVMGIFILGIGSLIVFPYGPYTSGTYEAVSAVAANGTESAVTHWWDNIGGCGVGGAGGGAGGGAKWIGRSVTGGLVDFECMNHISGGGDYLYFNNSQRISYTFLNSNTVGLSLPFTYKTGTYELGSGPVPLKEMVNGLGNLGLDYSRSFGEAKQMSLTLAGGFPTGKYDHRRFDPNYDYKNFGDEGYQPDFLVTPDLQCGNGLYSLSLSGEYSIDRDWGLMIFGFSYSGMLASFGDLLHPGAQNDVYSAANIDGYDPFPGMPPLTEKVPYNAWMDWPEVEPHSWTYSDPAEYTADSLLWYDQAQYKQNDTVTIANKYHVWDPENATGLDELKGDYFSNSLGVNFTLGYKTEYFVHSLQTTYSYKLDDEWYVRAADEALSVKDKTNNVKEIYLNPVMRTERHNFSLAYGLEMSSMTFPVFFGWNLAFNEKEFQNMTMSMGVRGSFF